MRRVHRRRSQSMFAPSAAGGALVKRSLLSIVSLVLAATALPAAAETASYKPARTPDGKPDLQGVWTNVSLTTLLRTPQFKTNVVTAEEAQRVAQRRAA